jgi:transaldolase
VNTKTLDERLRERGRAAWAAEVAKAKQAAYSVVKYEFISSDMRLPNRVSVAEHDGEKVYTARIGEVLSRLFEAIESAGQTLAEEREIAKFLKEFDSIKQQIENVVGELTRDGDE